MTDREALIAAVIADPASDVPRLIFADWLEEHGEPERAEFIRVQCELARMPQEKVGWRFLADGSSVDAESRAVADKNPRRERLRRRERELLNSQFPGTSHTNRLEWSGIFGSVVRLTNTEWRRGFIGVITLSAADWLRHADALAAAAPLREVTLTTFPDIEERETGYAGGEFRFAGRPWKYFSWSSQMDRQAPSIGERLLAGYWPAITFCLPAE